MDQRTIQLLCALLRSAICRTALTEEEQKMYSSDLLKELLKISTRHDVVHLVVLGLKLNDLIREEYIDIEKSILKAVYRYERSRCEFENLCTLLEKAEIPFIPLKGAVIRKYYPEAWMRTSCDIDILVHREDLEKTISYLTEKHKYSEVDRSAHDVSLYSPMGINIELHFDLVEEGRAQNSIEVLKSVWDNVTLRENSKYWYEMNDAYFYFYHVAHMAKHFENGGCGIRPFIDLWIQDNMNNIDKSARDKLIFEGGLSRFAGVARALSKVWFERNEPDELLLKTQEYIMHGGVYGTQDNRVAIQQMKKGGRIGYILSRIFVPYDKLKRYYPVLVKHRWLVPVMQVRRWFMLLKPDVAKMAKQEIIINGSVEKSKADEMNIFLADIGLS